MVEYNLPGQLDSDINKLDSLIKKFKNSEISAAELKAHRVPFGVYEQREADTFMVRVRCPGGCITPSQLGVIAEISEKYGRDTIHLTTRQEIQVHYINLDDVVAIMRDLQVVNLASRGGGGNTVRNIISDEKGGVQVEEPFDVTPYAIELTNRLIAEDDSWTLPRKLKISFSGTDDDSGLATVADLGFIARIKEGKRGFKVYVAGGFGSKPQVGQLYFEFLPESEVYNFAEAVKQLFWKYGNRKNKNEARLRFLWASLGEEEFKSKLDTLYKEIQSESNPSFEIREIEVNFKSPELPSVKTDDEYVIWKSRFVSPQSQQGLNQVIVPVQLGFIDNFKIRKLAEFLNELGDDVIRFSKDQNIILRNIKESYLPNVYKLLSELQDNFNRPFILDHIISCAGASTCKLGFCLSRGAVKAIIKQLEGDNLNLDKLDKLTINISGCPNSCGQHPLADIGFFGRAGRKGEHMYPKYVVVAGARIADGQTSYARPLGDISARDLPEFLSEVLKNYLSKKDDSFYDYLENNGKDFIEKLLVVYENIPSFEDDKNYYFDWGSSELFSLAGRSQGECSAGLFDLMDVDLANMKRRLETLSAATDRKVQLSALKELVFYASSTLLITRGIQPESEDESFESFLQQFISTGIVSESYRELITVAKAGKITLNDREKIIDLCSLIKELYDGMDNAFQFKTADIDVKEKTEVVEKPVENFKDLRGVACPMNFVKTKMELSRIKSGEILVVFLDNGEPIENVPGSVRSEGHEILKEDKIENYWSITIKKK